MPSELFGKLAFIAQGFIDHGYKIVVYAAADAFDLLIPVLLRTERIQAAATLIRKAHKDVSPDGRIVVAGCYAQMNPQEIADMQGVDLILGTSEKYKVF